MEIGLHIGLASSNITLTSLSPIVWRNDSGTVLRNSTFFYNEKVPMFKPELLESSMDGALAVGLPVPLLTAIHFLTSATLDFHWSQDVMEAGYHCYLILVFALLVWFLALLFIAAIPRYSCYSFIVIGVLMISTNVIYFYWVMLDHHFPPFFISGQFIELRSIFLALFYPLRILRTPRVFIKCTAFLNDKTRVSISFNLCFISFPADTGLASGAVWPSVFGPASTVFPCRFMTSYIPTSFSRFLTSTMIIKEVWPRRIASTSFRVTTGKRAQNTSIRNTF
jgi:hypothetical protein